MIFVNLPVNDLEKSKAFYTALGFTINPEFTDHNAACIVISETIYVMLVVKEFFKRFTDKEIIDPSKATESLMALAVASRDAVTTMANAAVSAGGSLSRKSEDYGWMYQQGFRDPDGHLWEALYMDMSKRPKN